MRRSTTLAVALCLIACLPASAKLCAVDDVPAATLLLPYFEVDTTSGDGVTTLFSVINTSAEPTLVKVVLWTDLGIPSLDFDVYLTGFDVFTANLRDVFVGGRVPQTGEGLSPQGFDSFPNTGFPGCAGNQGGPLGETLRRGLVDFHLGRSSLLYGGLCGAVPRGDGVVRGFATVDVVRRCAPAFPPDDGYFGPEGVAGYQNRLVGDAFIVDPGNDFAQGENLVRLEADPEAFAPGDRTFYGAFVGGDGSDGREPLPAIWATRMIDGGGFDGGTQLTVWRGPTRVREPFACGGDLPQVPLSHEVFSFDEEENGFLIFPNTGILDPPPPLEVLEPFPRATNRVGRDDFPAFLPSPLGWLAVDLSELTFGGEAPSPFAQAWVGSTFSASRRFSVGLAGSPLSEACSDDGCTLGQPLEVGELCVAALFQPTQVRPGEPVEISLRPRGCFSSSCTLFHRLECAVGELEGSTLRIEPRLCASVNRQEGAICTADCNLQHRAYCYAEGGLPEGSYTVAAGDLELTLQVPSTIPAGGLCTGDPF